MNNNDDRTQAMPPGGTSATGVYPTTAFGGAGATVALDPDRTQMSPPPAYAPSPAPGGNAPVDGSPAAGLTLTVYRAADGGCRSIWRWSSTVPGRWKASL